LKFLESGEELEIGNIDDLPLSSDELIKSDENSPFVIQTLKGGLTAYIYKIFANGKYWCLKKKRENILVKNIDGQTSFLNEIQRRQDFEKLKKDPIRGKNYKNIIDTVYASNNKGIILSPWIEGEHINHNKKMIKSLFDSIYHMEIEGIFEFDFCSGNLLVRDNEIILFDFGYMYKFNPLTEYNPDGKNNPVFHAAERYESRYFFQYLMDLETEMGINQVYKEFRDEKEIVLNMYKKKILWLEKKNAQLDVINLTKHFIHLWELGLASSEGLEKLYALESFRSYVIDLADDLHGQSCSANTILKVDRILTILKVDYEFLKENNSLFWGDENESKEAIINKYRSKRDLVIKYQI